MACNCIKVDIVNIKYKNRCYNTIIKGTVGWLCPARYYLQAVDFMILTVDIGNSNIVFGGFENDKLTFTARISTDATKTEDEYFK